ncbi:Uncharacterised protein [Candidatus Venteria ishoeyi]|uniref:Phage integrase family protein n=2 Tax=Candidatus Venteria ishoeyi TaxID=1899563 RepID=A0A1H6F5G3_9GAMM|nr:Uncharacterised protein [Candidatus Venteria ishoeyi]
MGRNRKRRNSTLPPNLYEVGNGYYVYRHPRTGRKYGMGKVRAAAITAAKHLNSELAPLPGLAERILGEKKQESFANFLAWFQDKMLPTLELADSTRREYQNKISYIHTALGHYQTTAITVADVACFLDDYPPTQSNHYRSVLIILFKHAIARGVCEVNPAAATMKRKQKKIQQRLTKQAYDAIYVVAPVWLQNAMDLGLLTLQRRSDLAALNWEQVKDGYIWIQQQKVEKYGTGNLKIRITPEIQTILDRCQDGILSAHVLHRQPQKRRQAQGRDDFTAILPDMITKEWAKIRKKSGYYATDSDPRTLPGFHEIRSLGASIYEESKSKAIVQALLGHTSEKMTEHYLQGHKVNWAEVEL